MSGIYVKGMEMPKEAGTYRIEFDQCGNPYLLSENDDLGLWHIISVPDHGPLGDLDELKKHLTKPIIMDANRAKRLWEGWHECTIGVEQAIDALPIIISADKEVEK